MTDVSDKDRKTALGCAFCHSHTTHQTWCPNHHIEPVTKPCPSWPNVGLHPSEWAAAERAGYDMRQYYKIEPIPHS